MTARKLTVVQVLPALQSGGVERGTLEVGRHLVEHGHRSIVISAGGRLVDQLLSEGSEHVSWDIGKKNPWTLRLIPVLQRFLAQNRADILHARSRMPAWICYLAWKGMNPKTRPRFITTVHGLYSVNAYSAVMVKGEKVIAVSEAAQDYIVRSYPKIERERIELIPRGVEPAEFPYGFKPTTEWLGAWQAEHPQLAGRKILCLPARITRLKGHHEFIELVAQLRAQGMDVHGLIVGGEDPNRLGYAAEVRQAVHDRGLDDAISFTGARHDIREIYAISDIVFSLSTKPESFGRTVLEALCMGVPVVAYDHGGVSEILRTLYPAGRVEPENMGQLVATTAKLLETPDRVNPDNPYTLRNMLDRTLAVYERAAASLKLAG
ncbi:glycosyltransferase family 4 protein [Betaproteobacteria bacterium SCN2]|jgi:glycosyltransferase involved in cell wall biosynthesis|nr:glycosyltransferase family 4 protein [Betaproteobacteria bacterium SCN2]